MQVSSTVWFHIQQDGKPVPMTKLAQDWIDTNWNEFIGKHKWPPNSPDDNRVDYRVWRVMLERILPQAKQESPAVADKPARRLRKVCTVYVRAVGL